MSPEMATEEAALEEAWRLAQDGEDITAIEGPDGEIVLRRGGRGLVPQEDETAPSV